MEQLYKTSDGKVFDSKEEAIRHEAVIEVLNSLEEEGYSHERSIPLNHVAEKIVEYAGGFFCDNLRRYIVQEAKKYAE